MSGIERWEDKLWDRLPHMIKYTRTSLEWVDRYVKLTVGLQKLHKDYSKGLSKLIKTQKNKGVDARSMGRCWIGVIGHLGAVSDKHKQLATVLGDIGRKYGEECDLLTEEQRTLEENSRRFQGNLDTSIVQLEKAKEKFFRRQFEAEKAENALIRGEEDDKINNDELEKIRDNADEKKEKYNKARDEYSSQLAETNALQTEFYKDLWPGVLSGMRGIAERSMDCIVSLLRRLDLLGQDELSNLGVIADEMEEAIDEDFESFMNWVKSGNSPPGDFTFEETCKPGTVSFSTMGTLRKSLSRASLRITSSPVIGAGFGSRLSLRSPYATRSVTSPRVSSLREGHYYSNTPTIHENQSTDVENNHVDNDSGTDVIVTENRKASYESRVNCDSINEVDEESRINMDEDLPNEELSIDIKIENADNKIDDDTSSQASVNNKSKVSSLSVYISQDPEQPNEVMPLRQEVQQSPHLDEDSQTSYRARNGMKTSRSNSQSSTKQKSDSYDDRMNPFTEDFEQI